MLLAFYTCTYEICYKFCTDSSGEWVLSAQDIECLCIGAGILGCGGGGSPYFGELLAKKEINNGKEMKVVNPLRYDCIRNHTLYIYIYIYIYIYAATVSNQHFLFCFTDSIHLNKDCVLL